MSVIQTLSSAVTSWIKGDIKLKSINRDNYKTNLNEMISQSQMYLNSFFSVLSEDDRKNMRDALKAANGPAKEVYLNFIKGLNSSAKRYEDRAFLGSIENSLSASTSILNGIVTKLDDLFQQKSISLNNTRLSHVMVFGLVGHIDTMITFSSYLISIAQTAVTTPAEVKDIAPYKFKFLAANMANVQSTINDISNKTGIAMFQAAISGIKKVNLDTALVSESGDNNVDFIPEQAISSEASALIPAGIIQINFNIFRWIGETYYANLRRRNDARRTESKLIEARIALYRYNLAHSPSITDEERAALVKMINDWTVDLDLLRKKIADYEAGK